LRGRGKAPGPSDDAPRARSGAAPSRSPDRGRHRLGQEPREGLSSARKRCAARAELSFAFFERGLSRAISRARPASSSVAWSMHSWPTKEVRMKTYLQSRPARVVFLALALVIGGGGLSTRYPETSSLWLTVSLFAAIAFGFVGIGW